MKKLIFTFLLFLAIQLVFTKSAFAVNNPVEVPNNKFGIHIFSEKDLPDAAKLVNSQGGDWGYVTIVITEKERDHDRWQQVFDQMRRLHLIPTIRLATKANGSVWEKPKDEEINNWIAFLNSLNWVIQNRYVIIGNEPNLDNEWGGSANPSEYAAYLTNFSQKLKSASPDFFVLPAGLAPDKNEFKFIRSMLKADPKVFDNIDGWTSHSYPSTSLTLYSDELALINKDLPIFITETGWSNKNLNEDEIASRLKSAYENIWINPKIVAVTPFILNYPHPPFEEFSWTKSNGAFYKFYDTVRSLPKTLGAPTQIVQGDILVALAQPIAPVGSDFLGAILAKNTGQSIWSPSSVFIGSESDNLKLKSYSFNEIEPMRLGLIIFKAEAPQNTGIYSSSLFLKDIKGQKITDNFPIEVGVIKIDWSKIREFFVKITSMGR